MYINKLDDIVSKYNSTYRIIKMKPFDVKSITHTLMKKIMKILNLKFVIILEYQNIKTYLKKFL